MRKIHLLLFLVLLLFAITSQAQQRERISNPYGSPVDGYDKLNLGIGFGFDYGGIGGNLTYYPQKNFGLFFGGGYAFAIPDGDVRV